MAGEPPPSPPPPSPPAHPPPGFGLPAPPVPAGPEYASLWRRLVAWLADWIILSALNLAVTVLIDAIVAMGIGGNPSEENEQAFGVLVYVVAMLVNLAYYTFFWSHEGGGRTLGNRLLGIRVLRSNGELASSPRAFVRAVLMYVSIFAIFAGVIVSALTILATRRRQALHDFVCDTVVLREW